MNCKSEGTPSINNDAKYDVNEELYHLSETVPEPQQDFSCPTHVIEKLSSLRQQALAQAAKHRQAFQTSIGPSPGKRLRYQTRAWRMVKPLGSATAATFPNNASFPQRLSQSYTCFGCMPCQASFPSVATLALRVVTQRGRRFVRHVQPTRMDSEMLQRT